MSEPRERPIEKLLKSAGASRRDQAGTPKMHPATLEMLQTAVRRQYGPAPVESRGGLRRLLRWVPRVAVFAALGACAWLLWFRHDGRDAMPLARKEEQPSTASLEEDRLRVMEPASIPESAPAGIVRDGAGEAALADGRPPAATPRPAPTADSAASAARVARSKGSTGESPRSVVGADYFKADRQAIYMGTAAVEGEEETGTDVGRADPLAALMEAPKSEPPPVAMEVVAPVIAPLGEGSILQTFTVFTTGNVVRVLDADGSVYLGTIQPQAAASSAPVPASGTAKAGEGKALAGTEPAAGAVLVNYRFSTSGTNRSLQQQVRFDGELLLTDQQLQLGRNVFSNTILPVSGGKQTALRSNVIQSFPGRLQGTAMLGDGADVPVDAVPTAP